MSYNSKIVHIKTLIILNKIATYYSQNYAGTLGSNLLFTSQSTGVFLSQSAGCLPAGVMGWIPNRMLTNQLQNAGVLLAEGWGDI